MKETRISFPLGTQNVCPEGATSISPGLLGTGYPGLAAKFASLDDEGIFEESTRFQILNERVGRLVNVLALGRHAAADIEVVIQIGKNPERVKSFHHADSIEPRWGSKNFFRSSPRVAPFAQPWAELLNPVGIRNWRTTKSQEREVLA